MKTRVISSLILIPLLYAVYSGGVILKVAGIIIGLMALKEFYNAFKNMEIVPSFSIGAISCALLYLMNVFNMSPYFTLWLFVSIIVILVYILISKGVGLLNGAITLLGIIYILFFSYHVILIDGLENYRYFIWLVFITAFVTDIFAYFSGYLFGKHKLCPSISPKKTVEGAIGGMLGSVIGSAIFGYFIAPDLLWHFIIIGIIGSIAGQIGDLTASAVKRMVKIKDFGTLIPGHGGVLDRFDSILLTAPVIYYYVVFFIL